MLLLEGVTVARQGRRGLVQVASGEQPPLGYNIRCYSTLAFWGGAYAPVWHPLAVLGFRVGHSLAWGHYLHVSDLSTLPAGRGRGFAPQLLDWVKIEANRLGCDGSTSIPASAPAAEPLIECTSTLVTEISAHHFMQSLT